MQTRRSYMGWTPAGNDAYEKLIIIFAGNPGVYIFETKILKPFSGPPGVNRTEQIFENKDRDALFERNQHWREFCNESGKRRDWI